MKLSKLIERLEELQEELRFLHDEDFDPEVLAAHQPSYPLAGVIHGAAALPRKGEPTRVWIAVGGAHATGSPYAPRAAWDH